MILYPDIYKVFDDINFCDVAMTIEGVLTNGVQYYSLSSDQEMKA